MQSNHPDKLHQRIYPVNAQAIKTIGPVVYWMSRDQRVQDNWALIAAQRMALEMRQPLIVVFCLVEKYSQATLRHFSFMLQGLAEVEKTLSQKNIDFQLLEGNPADRLSEYCRKNKISVVFTDFDPLRIKRKWQTQFIQKVKIPFYIVDTHNIIPTWQVSDKQEYSARSFRIKVNRLLPEYLEFIPMLQPHPFFSKQIRPLIAWDKIIKSLRVDRSVGEMMHPAAGFKAGMKQLRYFIKYQLDDYAQRKNDPTLEGTSHLSVYFHFGQIAPQRAAWEVMAAPIGNHGKEVFLEEMIVRRELSDNYVYYNPHYDQVKGFPNWAKKTLAQHHTDIREYCYTFKQFESAATHDPLWNAAQMQMVRSGYMHGYMRMYWAKKILEWSRTPAIALQIGIKLNDKYQLDGRDPNGYTGLAWSIGGVHDRPWGGRSVFGQIRYMNDRGCSRKFNVAKYIEKNS